MQIGNYNYVCPYEYEYTHATLLCLLEVIFVWRLIIGKSAWNAAAAGFVLGLIFLTRAEFFIAAFATAILGFLFLATDRRIVRSRLLVLILFFLAAAIVPPTTSVLLLSIGDASSPGNTRRRRHVAHAPGRKHHQPALLSPQHGARRSSPQPRPAPDLVGEIRRDSCGASRVGSL